MDSVKICKEDVVAFMEYVKPTFCKVSFYEDDDMGEVAEFYQFQTKEEEKRAYEWYIRAYFENPEEFLKEMFEESAE